MEFSIIVLLYVSRSTSTRFWKCSGSSSSSRFNLKGLELQVGYILVRAPGTPGLEFGFVEEILVPSLEVINAISRGYSGTPFAESFTT